MLKLSSIPILLAALVLIAFGVRYLFTRQFMGYHAAVTGKSWPDIDLRMQIAILGMLRICGAGFLTYGIVLLWLLLPLSRGESWAAWATLSSAVIMLVPILYITIWLRRFEPKARTPVLAPLVVLLLVLAGAGAALA
jgi:hypothetical protein